MFPTAVKTFRVCGRSVTAKDYWRQDALKVSQTGLEKMKAAVEKALA